ncbi:hypothetical protein Slin15195_G105230 [Septoria linicola]|uniref:Uncharacterized protein n=1 Tax=Septoria linicola TaxID=215465 RepID=A0A9Q9AY39_9PEZI|nr:hypothetical protein Slin15195_G105230 [Septoria linicola]
MDVSTKIAQLREEIASLRWMNESLEKENVRLQSELDHMTQQDNYTEIGTAEHHGQSSQFNTTLDYWRDREQAELDPEGIWRDDSFNDSGWDEEINDQIANEHEEDTEDYAEVEPEIVPATINHWDFDHDKANCEEWDPDLLKPKPDNLICIACLDWEAEQKAIKEELSTDAQEVSIDRDFYDTPAAVVWLPWEDQYSAIHKAHQIAKQAFWYAYRHHWPVRREQGEVWPSCVHAGPCG